MARRKAATPKAGRGRYGVGGGLSAGALLLLVALYLLGDLDPGIPPEPPAAPGPVTEIEARAGVGQALAALQQIRVEPETRRGYRREDWPHWLDLDGNCLDTREEVLVAESVIPAKVSPDGCRVLAGRWIDPYTGEVLNDPRRVDIDHVVPLQEAHDSGGASWSRERRAAFANDLSDPRSLAATSAAANRAKGARDPAEWLPPDSAALCGYVADWVAIKAVWGLAMDEAERVTVGNILADCDARLAAGQP